MDGAAVDLLGPIWHRQRQAPIQQATEQQVEVGAVFFDVGDHIHEATLVIIVRRIINILHVTVIQLKNAEANVEVLGGQRVFFLDFLTGAADALFADFADVLANLTKLMNRDKRQASRNESCSKV